ncbi:4Fe-4S binding protein, partial [Candidatus Aerophobetes bacterium]|nr:4Fe-4S binding protein [Candidatus Aerophobetes bacterium]
MMLWKSKGACVEGIPTPDELKRTPGYPSLERLQEGPCAVIECIEEIPCNPCETACPFGAIKVGSLITNLPKLDEDKCTGCGVCISSCPGLAIFIINLNYTDKLALVSFPFEFLPLPPVGEEVLAVDRKGKKIYKGKVVKVSNKPKQDRTPVVSIS